MNINQLSQVGELKELRELKELKTIDFTLVFPQEKESWSIKTDVFNSFNSLNSFNSPELSECET